jgi:hypothetical protein
MFKVIEKDNPLAVHCLCDTLERAQYWIDVRAPCSLESVACWVESQLNLSTVDFVRCVDSLVRQGSIELSIDGAGIVIDLR